MYYGTNSTQPDTSAAPTIASFHYRGPATIPAYTEHSLAVATGANEASDGTISIVVHFNTEDRATKVLTGRYMRSPGRLVIHRWDACVSVMMSESFSL